MQADNGEITFIENNNISESINSERRYEFIWMMMETFIYIEQKATMNQLTKIISEIIVLILRDTLMMILILMIYLKRK